MTDSRPVYVTNTVTFKEPPKEPVAVTYPCDYWFTPDGAPRSSFRSISRVRQNPNAGKLKRQRSARKRLRKMQERSREKNR